ncbi:MAG TPA: methionine--tRNA ligase [Candidatus Acidoferrales bacterium]|nr:methionine--tRNA ligase [Candidatus Acidoferrales bacterium]
MDQSQPKPKFYLTTPIYYANSRPHVGSAYTTIVCDVIARYKRMCGYDVAYTTGTDEHGVNIERAAEAQGISPAELVDRNQQVFLDLWKLLGIQYTHFVRTTETRHALAVQNLIRRTQRLNPHSIYKRKYEGRYCIYDNLYVSDTPEPANCEVCGRPAELISEENYFFRLSDYAERLLKLYEEHPEFVQPDFRRNEVVSFVKAGLKDLSISRKSIKWGIPWPGDPEHVFYVWYDALTSYMTSIGFVDGVHDGEDFKKFWLGSDSRVFHMIGKEIIRFHAVYWPAFLMAAELPLPKQIFAHGWLLFEQEKMSKSKGNVAYPEPIVKALNELSGSNVGNDALRYYLLRETVFGHDGNFSRDALLTRYNADLANGLGNLASRTLTMISKYCEDHIPPLHDDVLERGQVVSPQIKSIIAKRESDIQEMLARYEFSEATQALASIVSETDKLITSQAPWTYAEDPDKRPILETVLRIAVEELRFVIAYMHPVIPDATQKIWEQLGMPGKVGEQKVGELKWGALLPGIKIRKPEAVYPRIDKSEASERIAAMENEIRNPAAPTPAKAEGSLATSHSPLATASTSTAAPQAASDKISIDDFAKVQLRVGVVQSAERIPGADKLLKILVDIGDEVRQVLAGIAQHYAPETLIGRKVVVVVNLAPRKMRGLESNGMIVAASVGPEGRPVLATFTEDVPAGARLK